LVEPQQSYESFGSGTVSQRTRYGYTSRERDDLTELMYYRTRWYDPSQGRFLAEDSLGIGGGLNLYTYVNNHPINAIDPLGLQELKPLGRGNKELVRLQRDELEKAMSDQKLPPKIREKLSYGCIGLVSVYQGMDAERPENAKGTKCYITQKQAESRQCNGCEKKTIFAKQGKWSSKGSQKGDPKTGEDPSDSISNDFGYFNYIIYFPTTRSYVWMNQAYQGPGSQITTIFSRPLNDPLYPQTIWCSTCKPCK